MLRPLFVLTSLIAFSFLVFGPQPARAEGPFKVGLVLDKGGKDDKSFNAAAFKGGQEIGRAHV